ncbi:Re/Si-specific NAD(P)(+) transhydrogenase subunit alpha [Puniceicoccales bacterium CK1056]|uniref:proton-translocating NAD(P)(+) transhydrogenase n=1 Tax=Oceanipulchritudo coccoides TaxID=2706888 RepID=A0A6B2M469_9BACT|nr:Re/Si-specific NAD(P)(+) transhydrogenase subunit alpha [Oceanipulchritudo coccoides]NDV62625.1 Re/Si-specific NAD(P)(+) transhydrogenase subunit alpha [Oceanipulchritudo coccoides]
MHLFCPREPDPETRASADPESVKKMVDLGLSVTIESGAGLASDHDDLAYVDAGAGISENRDQALANADIVLRVGSPEVEEIAKLKRGALHVSFLNPFARKDLLKAFAEAGVHAVSMEMMPRTTLAQKMDAISSQANLAGYYSVILAAERLNRILPMMMTPAGTISPARVFVIGVGVAGLQAIATAKRLGARVEAFDTRPVVEEQVRSLGAKFVKIDLGETGQTDQGYAKELTPEQIEMQRKGMAKVCAQSDIVVTTAKLFGRPAPTLVTKEMVAGMKRGSILVDLAAETGGNVEGTVAGEEVETKGGVRIIGLNKLEACLPCHATQVYASNLANFIEHFWDKEAKAFQYNLEDEILKGCLMTHDGEIRDERFRD